MVEALVRASTDRISRTEHAVVVEVALTRGVEVEQLEQQPPLRVDAGPGLIKVCVAQPAVEVNGRPQLTTPCAKLNRCRSQVEACILAKRSPTPERLFIVVGLDEIRPGESMIGGEPVQRGHTAVDQ